MLYRRRVAMADGKVSARNDYGNNINVHETVENETETRRSRSKPHTSDLGECKTAQNVCDKNEKSRTY